MMVLPPDALTYLQRASGDPVPRPFAWRVGWPLVLRAAGVRHVTADEVDIPGWVLRWWPAVVAVCYVAIVACLGWRAGLLVCALPMARQWWHWRLMPDAPAFALALAASVAPTWLAIPLAVVAGSLHERAPVFAAVWSWSPLPLLGLLVPALAAALSRSGPGRTDGEGWIVGSPVRSAVLSFESAPAWAYLLPWGGALLALAHPLPLPAIVALGLAYAQCLIAVDRARLYQWAAPAIVPLACAVAGDWSWGIVIGTIAIPWTWSAVAGSPWPITVARK